MSSRLKTGAPGTVCFCLGVALAIYIMYSKVTYGDNRRPDYDGAPLIPSNELAAKVPPDRGGASGHYHGVKPPRD